MGYTLNKQLLEDHKEIVEQLILMARERTEGTVEFTDWSKAQRYQFDIRNILHCLAYHYPQHKHVATDIRTWLDKDYDNGIFTVHIGTPNNYQFQRHGVTQKKRRMPRPTVRGRPPEPPGPLTHSDAPSLGLLPPHEDVFEYNDKIDANNFMTIMPLVMDTAELRHSAVIKLNNLWLSRDIVKYILNEFAADYTLEDFEQSNGVNTKLVLRLRSKGDDNG
jgi:hypothetical protein